MGKKQRAIRYAGLWMVLIFAFSAFSGDESSLQSGRVVALVLSIVRGLFGENTAVALARAGLAFFIRKAAHFTEYAVLGFLVARALFLNGIRPWMPAILICAAYACLDEFHQSFVPGRSMQLRDVCIDSSGAIVGVLLFLAVCALKRADTSASAR